MPFFWSSASDSASALVAAVRCAFTAAAIAVRTIFWCSADSDSIFFLLPTTEMKSKKWPVLERCFCTSLKRLVRISAYGFSWPSMTFCSSAE